MMSSNSSNAIRVWVAVVLLLALQTAQAEDTKNAKLLGIGLPIDLPIEGELELPIDLPIEGELELPIDLPIEGELELPIDLPIEGELELSIDLPIEGELELPIDLPKEGELELPIDLPIEGEVELPIDLPIEGELELPIDLPVVDDGLLDGDLLDELLELVDDVTELPLPIIGPDSFEPDNAPSLAVWSGLQDITSLLTDQLLPLKDTHNLHVAEDEDWSRFTATQNEVVQIETRDVYPMADTFLTIYREAEATEVMPSTGPASCGGTAWIEGPNGEQLVVIACNDDTGEAGPQGIRSRVQFVAPATGVYFSRVTLSPKAPLIKSLFASGGETTYNYQATSKGMFSTTLYCSLVDTNTDDTIESGKVIMQPYSVSAKQRDGVYVINGLQDGSYTLNASAPGYVAEEEIVFIDGGGTTLEVVIRMKKTSTGGTTGGTTGGNTGGNTGDTTGGTTGGNAGGTNGGTTDGDEEMPSFDYAAPYGQVTLAEVLRAVQLFNARGYHCDGGTEDAYAPYQGNVQCAPHPLDYKNQDWTLDLSELLRMVQFFSLGGYHPCANGEGGLCAGASR